MKFTPRRLDDRFHAVFLGNLVIIVIAIGSAVATVAADTSRHPSAQAPVLAAAAAATVATR